MKNIVYIICFLSLPLSLMAQSTDQNYILTRTFQNETGTSAFSLDQVQYFDGLGRPVETVQKGITPTGGDLVNLTEYDAVGRAYKQWLPMSFASNAGAYVAPSAITGGSPKSYYANDANPFIRTLYEETPLNRVAGQIGAGSAWETHPSTINYQNNNAEVIHYKVNASENLVRDGSYLTSLYNTLITDEDGKTSTEYKDQLGQVIMKQSSTDVKTYFVYDDFGRLRYVLPPLAADALTTDGVISENAPALLQYAYTYKYDERGNNVVKRLPGCDSICMVYDKANRLVLSQDGNQRDKTRKPKSQWTVIKYDEFGRVVYTGIIDNDSTRVQFKPVYSDKLITETYTSGTGYSTKYFATAKPLAINFYDDYAFTGITTNGGNLNWVAPPTGYDAQYPNAKGLLTGTRTYILDKAGTNYLTTVMYYDYRRLVVQTRATNHLGGYDYSYNHYDFTGRVLKTYKEHSTAAQPVIPETYTYTYDNAGRPATTTYKIFSAPAVLLTNNTYDELGRVLKTYRHNAADTIAYAYNVRSWTTMIKSGTFAEYLNYNTSSNIAATPCFNGNIASATYNYNGTVRTYNYWYNALNRLTSGVAFQFAGGIPTTSVNAETFTYDKQGNIKTLKRQSGTTFVDDLVMNYPGSGNQVKSITDAKGSQNLYSTKEYYNKANTASEMSYDKNGNMTKDLDRDIVTIRYNILNLPDTIQFKYGNQIINRYAADGRKLYTEYFTKITQLTTPIDTGAVYSYVFNRTLMRLSGTDYIGNIEYRTTLAATGKQYVLQRVHNPEGYSNTFSDLYVSTNYFYLRRDHLGNTREVWLAPYTVYAAGNIISPGSVVQRTQYYPSGLPWAEGFAPDAQPYKYNGKEFIEMHGYDISDYGWRGLENATMRFNTVDPHAENYYSVSPYAYVENNAINNTDPNGADVVHNFDGSYTITGADIYTYYDYLTYISAGTGSMDNLSQSLDQASQKSDGSGGPMDGTLSTSTITGTKPKGTPYRDAHDPYWRERELLYGFSDGYAEVCYEVGMFIMGGMGGALLAPERIALNNIATQSVLKEGVYDLLTSEGRYIGQGKNAIKRALSHFKFGGKLANTELKKAIYNSMPGSTQLEREAYEQYLITKYGGPGNLINVRNPMGGRMTNYMEIIDGVIQKFNLPK